MHTNHRNECVEHPLGILCRCAEFKKIVDNFVIYTVSTQLPIKSKLDREANANSTLSTLSYCQKEEEKINETNVKKRWIPVKIDLVSPKEIRPNTCYLHNTERHTQSASTSTLTDMLPHRGRAIRRKDIEWSVGSHEIPVQMTDELETTWPKINSCFSTWADAFTVSMGYPPF